MPGQHQRQPGKISGLRDLREVRILTGPTAYSCGEPGAAVVQQQA